MQAPPEARDGFAFRFRCRRSGNCCAQPEGLVRVDAANIRAIARHLSLSEPAVRSRFVAASGDRLAEGLGGRCPFLEDGARASCTIYPVRPKRCQTWPFWDELRDPERLAEAARSCPGIEPDGAEGSAPGFTPLSILPMKEK